MPVKKLTNIEIKKLLPEKQRYVVRDTEIQGLMVRVEPSGKKVFYLDYKHENKRSSYKIGDATILTVMQAREIAKEKLADVIRGAPLIEKISSDPTVKEVFQKYTPYVLATHKTRNAIEMIERDFLSFFDKKCSTLSIQDLDAWRSDQRSVKKASSINRVVNAFRAMLRWAKDREIIQSCPFIEKKLKVLFEADSEAKIRYLSPEERRRLLTALTDREQRQGRDYLRPAVVVALNTGVRRNALFSLRWEDVDFSANAITLKASSAKSQKTSYIPMNEIVIKTLQEWKHFQRPISNASLVFPNPTTGEKMHDCRSSWEKVLKDAAIEKFRWHDMRHDFASQLVMSDISILTVMELMTHGSLNMTLKYAHLAPKRKKDAVDVLNALYK